MKPGDKAKRLRIYLSSTDKFQHTPLFEVIVYAARNEGINGATVTRGMMGYGASSEIQSNKLWEISEKLPLIVEIIDQPQTIDALLEKIIPYIDESGKGHLITIDETYVVIHKSGTKK